MFENPLINAFATLIITVGVVAVLLYFVKKYSEKFTSTSFSHKSIKIESKQALSSKSFLFIVNIEGRRFVIGANDNSISKISELDSNFDNSTQTNKTKEEELPKELQEDISFANFLKQSLLKQKKN